VLFGDLPSVEFLDTTNAVDFLGNGEWRGCATHLRSELDSDLDHIHGLNLDKHDKATGVSMSNSKTRNYCWRHREKIMLDLSGSKHFLFSRYQFWSLYLRSR